MNELLKQLSDAYDSLQALDIKPTKRNVIILHHALDTIQDAFKALEKIEIERQGQQRLTEEEGGGDVGADRNMVEVRS